MLLLLLTLNLLLCMRSFFSRNCATVSPPLLRGFALGAVSFSTSCFLCPFCVPSRFFRALFLISTALALSTFVLSFCVFSSTTAISSNNLLKCFFSVTQICIYSTCLFSLCVFALNMSLKSVCRSLTDRFVTLNWVC